jgi:hypothetical protein
MHISNNKCLCLVYFHDKEQYKNPAKKLYIYKIDPIQMRLKTVSLLLYDIFSENLACALKKNVTNVKKRFYINYFIQIFFSEK